MRLDIVTGVPVANLPAFMVTAPEAGGRDALGVCAASDCFKWGALIHFDNSPTNRLFSAPRGRS